MQKRYFVTAVAGLTLLLVTYAAISPGFVYDSLWLDRPTYLAVALLMLAGALWVFISAGIRSISHSTRRFHGLIALGLLLRLVMIPSTPVFEDDFYRYFLDGALVTQNLNPYLYTPADAQPIAASASTHFPVIQQLESSHAISGSDSVVVSQGYPELVFLEEQKLLERVTYPYIRTIYPPITQLAFALSHTLAPWSLTAWRFVLLLIDCLSLVLLVQLLEALNQKRIFAMVYWLNPIAITETINAAHMDVLLLPFLLGAATLVAKGKHTHAGAALACAVGVKLWPLILAPAIFWPFIRNPAKLIKSALPFGVISILLLSPQLLAGINASSGVYVYAQDWQTNAFAFSFFVTFGHWLSNTLDMSLLDGNQIARIFTVLLVICVSLYSLKFIKPVANSNGGATAHNIVLPWLITSSALFLLSPTGYPWYFLWFLPWLAIYPVPALLLLSITLPLYDLRFVMQALGKSDLFDSIVTAIEFLPIFLALAIPRYRRAKPRGELND